MLTENVLLGDVESYVNAGFLCFCIPIATLTMTSGKMSIDLLAVTASQNTTSSQRGMASEANHRLNTQSLLIMHEQIAHYYTSLKWQVCWLSKLHHSLPTEIYCPAKCLNDEMFK